MPYEVSNPVKFYAGGDTTSQAIKKHIDEFLRVYSILNTFGTGKAAIVTSPNTVLKNGEIGVMLSPWALKVGNGVSKWYQLQGASVIEIIDNLLSESPDKALSAKQGKALKELIDAIHIPEIVDDLTTGGSDKTLSAEQGKSLKGIIDTLTTPVPGPPGPKGLEWRGAWDGTAEYRKDDAVSYHRSSYIALKPSTGEPPSNAEFWGVLSAKGADGTGAGDMMKADYDTDGDGKVDAAAMADTAAVANSAKAVAWNDVTGKPEKFTCDIVDALDSDRVDAALSAKQGKVLNALIEEVKAGRPKTFLRIVKDISVSGAKLSTPGMPTDTWFVRVFFSQAAIPTTNMLSTPIPLFRDPNASLFGGFVGAGMLISGSKSVLVSHLVSMGLCSQGTLIKSKSIIFAGEKVNLS